jgi:pilus assembly protein CpaE
MYPLTVGLAIHNRLLMEQTKACLADLPFRVIVEREDLSELPVFLDRLERMRPDVVLLDISEWATPLEELALSVREAAGDPMIVALQTSADADSILATLRAGINEYIYPPIQDSLRKALERRSTERSCRRDGGKPGAGKAFAFFSSKGGCGATTLACHVAADLGRQDQRVLLADFDMDSGLVGFITKTKATYSILDAFNNMHRLDIHFWKALVSNGVPGVEILSAPPTLAVHQPPKDDQVRRLVAFARPHYDWTIVDLGRGLNRVGMAALEEIDEACIVATLEVPALHLAKQVIQTLLDSGYGKNRIRLILNRAPKRLDISPAELEKMLGLPIFCMIPNDYVELYETYAEGRMLQRTSDVGKHISRLASKLTNLKPEKPQKKRFALFG